ncbi:MAG: DUF4124 domain-containing protein [Rudaea sp.]
MINKILLVALIGLCAVAHANDLYKWTDDKGVTHYSDTPPSSQATASRIHVATGVTSDVAADAATDPGKPKDPGLNPNPAAGTPVNQNKACDQARSNLSLLQSKYQVADASGKPLDDKTREALITQAKQALETCDKR